MIVSRVYGSCFGLSLMHCSHLVCQAHGNRNQKLCEAVRKTSSLASAAGELANVSEQLASEFEKEIGNMNVFTALKKAINLEVK